MSTPAPAGRIMPRDAAADLADALADLGLTATVLATGEHQIHPCVLIAPRPAIAGRSPAIPGAHVYVAPSDDNIDAPPGYGTWWFWTSDLHPLAPVNQVITAADTIVAALTGSAPGAVRTGRA